MILKSLLNKFRIFLLLNIKLLFFNITICNSQSNNVKFLLTLDWRFNSSKEIINIKSKDTLEFVSCYRCYELKDSLVLNNNIRFYRTLRGDSDGFRAFKFGNVFKISYHKNIYKIGVGDVIDVQGYWKYKKKHKILIFKGIEIYEPKLDSLFENKKKVKFEIIEINERNMKLLVK